MRLALQVFRLFNFSLSENIVNKFSSDDLRSAIKYFSLRYNLDLTLRGVIGASIFLSLLVSMVFFLFTIYFFCFNFLFSIFFSLLLFVSTYFYLSTYLVRRWKYEKSLFAKYSYFILEDMYLALVSTGSLINAIAFVCDGDYPKISKDFKNILFQCFDGSSPEYLIRKYAFLQPSSSLREGLITMVSTPLISRKFSSIISKFSSSEIRKHFRDYLAKLELYCLIIIMQGLLFPISMVFTSSLFMVDSSIFIFILVLLQLFILILLSFFFMKQPIQPLG